MLSLQRLCQVFNSHCHTLGAKRYSDFYLALSSCLSFHFPKSIILEIEESPSSLQLLLYCCFLRAGWFALAGGFLLC
jgi:hypothetical protein